MTVNIKSLQGRLANIAREKQTELQLLLNRFGAEQFLFRLSQSSYANRFIFKGGFLLAYLIDSERKTKDLDFSITEMELQVDDVIAIVKEILAIPIDDGIEWGAVEGKILEHPEMESPGVRLICRFLLGKMKGNVRMDLARGDVVKAIKHPLKRIRYNDEPLMGGDFSLMVYPLETVFAEKLHIVFKKGAQNTRMKDYYDLMKLTEQSLSKATLRKSIQKTFQNRNEEVKTHIHFDDSEIERLQTYWGHFLKRDNPPEAPKTIDEVIATVNDYLRKLYD